MQGMNFRLSPFALFVSILNLLLCYAYFQDLYLQILSFSMAQKSLGHIKNYLGAFEFRGGYLSINISLILIIMRLLINGNWLFKVSMYIYM